MNETPTRLRHNVGLGWSLTSAFLWATTYISGRYLMAAGSVDPVTLSMSRFVVGGALLMLTGVLLFRRRLFAVSTGDLAKLAVLGAFGVAGMSLFFFFGQRTVSAITSALIMQTSPVMIYFSSMLVGERLRVKGIAGICVSLAGCLLVIGVFGTGTGGGVDGQTTGCLFILLSAVCWTVYSVAGKPLVEKLGGFTTTTWAMLFGALEIAVIWALGPFDRAWPVSATAWGVIAYIAIFPTAVAFLAWYEAMARLPLPLLNIMQYLTPVFTIILAWAILGERLTGAMIGGAALVLCGVALTTERQP